MRDDVLIAELLAREALEKKQEKFLFDKQLAFVNDPNPFAQAMCSRRSGKTVACAEDLLATANETPGCVTLYLTLARTNAKRIFWPVAKDVNEKQGFSAIANESDLSLTLPNKSVLYASGARTEKEIEKFLGLPIKKVYIDEGQSFGSYLEDLIDRVLAPALMDYAGSIRLIGTPPPVPVGPFIDILNNPNWSHHTWTFFDNPHIPIKSGKTHMELLERELKRRGVSIDDPTIQREWFGKLKHDSDSLVLTYEASKNDYLKLPDLRGDWNYIVGVDLGFDDSDAIAVIGWNEASPNAYLVEELETAGQGITELAEQLDRIVTKYKPLRLVCDTGGLGKKIAEELRKRYGLPVVAAEKTRKYEFLAILNDALRTARFFAKRGSRFANDCALMEWDHDKSTPDRRVVSDRYHSDIADAVLYAYREALHWLHVPAEVPVLVGSEAWVKQQEEAIEAEVRLQNNQTSDDMEGFAPLDPLDPWPT